MKKNTHYLHVWTGEGSACAIISDHADGAKATTKTRAPKKINTSRMHIPNGYQNDTHIDFNHTLTDDLCSRLPDVNDYRSVPYTKGYKIYVRPIGRDVRHTLIGFVVCDGDRRKAYDVFGKQYVMHNGMRLREKQIRVTFNIDDRFEIKTVCVQFVAQRDSMRDKKRSPHIPDMPIAKRPNIA